jgi:hypothetical protein
MTPEHLESAMDVQLDFICDTCGFPVEDGQGAIYVRFEDIRNYQSQKADWLETRPEHGALDLPTLMAMPVPIPWHIHHNACAPADVDVYGICVEQVRTWRQLLKWTAHLMPKNWLSATNWASVVGDAAEGRTSRIAEHARDDAA